MDKKIPVTNCTPNIIPKIEPPFHQIENLIGLGKSVNSLIIGNFRKSFNP